MQSFSIEQEIISFLETHPDTEVVELLLADINGIFRGKKIPVSGLRKLATTGMPFPISTCFLTADGATADTIVDEYGADPDRTCVPVSGSLKTVPWANRPTAQVLITMQEHNGQPFFMDPRTVLNNVLESYKGIGLKPVIALEYEFFLFEAGTVPPSPIQSQNGMPAASGPNCYNLDVACDFGELLEEIERSCLNQGLEVIAIVCEYGTGQFEVNLAHTDNVTKACDDALLLKRAVKSVARKHGLHASFMAKPLKNDVGNGLHAHVSLLDQHGVNIFGIKGGEEKLQQAVGGLIETMAESTAFFAPNANSYRRFDPSCYVPIVPNWGENNRRLSVRLPLSDSKNRRFEHRVSGADACPHLVIAAILAGALYGLQNASDPGPKLGEFDAIDYTATLPPRWLMALEKLAGGNILQQYFGTAFIDLYLRVRKFEEESFHQNIGQADYERYLRIL